MMYLLSIILLVSDVYGNPFVWPLPSTFTINPTLDLNVDNAFKITTQSTSTILQNGIIRYMNEIIFTHVPDETPPSTLLISSLVVTVSSDDEDILQFGVDESYSLNISSTSSSCTLNANTIYGALKGLETFSQLIIYNFTLGYYQSYSAIIQDSPRFSWRGMLIDSSRHYQSIKSIKNLLNAMSYAKFNVLHWHIVDTQSFPYQSEIYPKFADGAYGQYQRYSLNDISGIVTYAKERGIRVVPEFDIPGHTMSWCVGYPEICPNPSCNSPNGESDSPDGILNPANNRTYQIIEGLFKESSNIFIDNYFHIGGDETHTKCWDNTTEIVNWEKINNFTDNDALLYFNERALDIVNNVIKKSPIQWDEMFTLFGNDIDNNCTTIQVWHDPDLLASVTAAGFNGIMSPHKYWYLNKIGFNFTTIYTLEPLQYINNATQSKLVLGGEACAWGENIDISDIEQTIWPRAAAVAERLWSPRNVNNTITAQPRYAYFRCLLNQRGVAAAPYNNTNARTAPSGPGSCYLQR